MPILLKDLPKPLNPSKKGSKSVPSGSRQYQSLVSKNRGGRPRKTPLYYNRKVTLYLGDEEYESLNEFASLASYRCWIGKRREKRK
jgi:hypothetical protein